jgi:tetratricopeptide (TPR) repeat protein
VAAEFSNGHVNQKIEDELKLGTKKAAPASAAPAPQQPAARANRKALKAERIVVRPAAGESVAEAWDRYFAGQEARLSSVAEPKPALEQLLASVRETVRQLMSDKEKKYGDASALIEAALRHGQVESWMYEALALAIRADSADKINKGMTVDAAQTEALERALLSAVDFAQDEDQVVMIAAYMAQAGLPQRALNLYQQISKANPSRAEAYLQGLALAQRLNDVPAIEWACVGILSQAWSGEQRELAERAFRIARATYDQLLADGRKSEAEAFDVAVRRAQERDCVVKITWTGDADIDLVVEEPAGTVLGYDDPGKDKGNRYKVETTLAEVPVATLTNGQYSVNVHKSTTEGGIYVACVDIPKR